MEDDATYLGDIFLIRPVEVADGSGSSAGGESGARYVAEAALTSPWAELASSRRDVGSRTRAQGDEEEEGIMAY
jgi:hypothetical protein